MLPRVTLSTTHGHPVLPFKARVIALASLTLSLPCLAQTPEEVRSDAQIHLGPLYVTPRLAVKEFGVDTNVFNSADAKRDFTFTLSPSARISVPFGRRAVVRTRVGGDVVYYQRYGTERSINPEVSVRTDGYIGRVLPFVEVGYLRSRQRPNFEIDARSLREERVFKAGTVVKVSARTSVELAAEERPVEFGADSLFNDVNLQETLNRTTSLRWIEGRYELTPLTTIVLRTESARDRFAFSPLRDADSTAILPGVEFKPRALVSGSAQVGFRRFDPLNDGLAPFSGVVANASLSYTLQGTTKFSVIANRDVTYSYERAQPYYLTTGVGVTVRRQIVGRFDVSGSLRHQRYAYRNLLLPGAVLADTNRIDTTRSWAGSLGYRVGSAMRAGFGLMHQSRDSSSARLRDYQGIRVISTLDYEF